MEKYIEREKVHTRCPECKTDIDDVWVLKLESSSVLRYAYFCTNCQKKLGVFSRKGYPSADVYKSPLNAVTPEV